MNPMHRGSFGEEAWLFQRNRTEQMALRNGNPSGDPSSAPRCGARTRRADGRPCQAPAIRGKRRCRMHGGLSTGPRTPEGLERSRRARWKHGNYSRAARQAKRIANRETWESAQPRLRREARRADRRANIEARRNMRDLDLLLKQIVNLEA
jgi:hypothetical protein